MNTKSLVLSWQKLVKSQWLALILIVIVAAGLRFYRLDRLPPGLDYDEGFNNLQALRIVRDRKIPIFITEEYGALPMHHWLIALLFCLTGPIVLGGRLVSAFVGVLAVGLLYFAVREIFYQEVGAHQSAVLGLVAALSLALLYWHVHYSRIGMEPTMVPPLTAAALGWIWRAVRRRRVMDAVIAGTLLGGCVYTYPAAYFAPLLIGFFFGLWMLVSRSFAHRQWRTLAISALGAVVVAAPLILFALTHSETFFLRSGQVVNSTMSEFFGALSRLIGSFLWQGDLDPRLNLAGRPILDLFQGIFFLLGLGVCVARRRPAHLFVLAWLVAMFLPSLLTDRAPHFGRALGATPPIAALIALGSVQVYRWILCLSNRARWPEKIIAGAVLSIAFVWSGVHTARDYFVEWGSVDNWLAFEGDLRWAGEYIGTLPHDEPVYLASPLQDHPTLRFLLNDRPDRVHGYDGQGCFVYSETVQQTTHYLLWVMPDQDAHSPSWLRVAFPKGQEIVPNRSVPSVMAYRVPAGSMVQLSPRYFLNVQFGDHIVLRGYDLEDKSWLPGETIMIRLYWQTAVPVTTPYKVFVHLWSVEEKQIEGQQDIQPGNGRCPFPSWRPSDTVMDEYYVPISPDAPPGAYELWAGIYQQDGPRLSVSATSGRDHWVLAAVQVR